MSKRVLIGLLIAKLLNQKTTLISIGDFNLNFGHILIFLIISLSFSTSFLIRSLPGANGWELNEFDPFFNYRATEFLINNGLFEYLNWYDELSWYPIGRDVSSNSQVMLHFITGFTFLVFNFGMSLYEYTILFPIIIGSLTSITIFALTRIISGTTAALFSTMLFSISLPILVRGSIGWFKSEPLGLFLGILGTYIFLSGIRTPKTKNSFIKFGLSGIILVLGISAWGGNQFFLFPLCILMISLPFIEKNNQKLKYGLLIFSLSFIICSLLFERPGPAFFTQLGGLLIIFPTIFQFISYHIQKISNNKKHTKNSLIVLMIMLLVLGGIFLVNEEFHLIKFPTHRYLNSILPILTTSDPLTDSVSEHATLNLPQSFQFHSVLMIFASIGVWLTFENKNKKIFSNPSMKIYILVLGFFGLYLSSAFMRLEVFGSISIIILSSIGLAGLIRKINNKELSINNKIKNFSLIIGLIFLLMIPLFLPTSSNVLSVSESLIPTILNGGSRYQITTNDWFDSLDWIKNNTPKDSVIGAWWDYGYWIQTVSERKTLADNSTLMQMRIKLIANSFFENPDDAWLTLRNDLGADYFVIFITAEKLPFITEDGKSLYLSNGGGDESKKFWFSMISDYPINDFINDDNISGTEKFWNETFLGQIIPFKQIGFVNFETNQISEEYIPGWTPVFEREIKLSADEDPFKLVYSSPSYDDEIVIGVFVYEINKNYILSND